VTDYLEFVTLRHSEDVLAHKNGFKYIKRYWKNGKWNYVYKDKQTTTAAQAVSKAASKAANVAVSAIKESVSSIKDTLSSIFAKKKK